MSNDTVYHLRTYHDWEDYVHVEATTTEEELLILVTEMELEDPHSVFRPSGKPTSLLCRGCLFLIPIRRWTGAIHSNVDSLRTLGVCRSCAHKTVT